jgi:hypothetical protein
VLGKVGGEVTCKLCFFYVEGVGEFLVILEEAVEECF